SNNAPELSDLVEFVKQKKEGHLAITPKSGKAPVKVWFDRKPLTHEGFKCPFTFQDGVLYLGGEAKRSHAKGLRQTLKDEGWFNVSVALAGETVEVEGSEFDEVADEWAAMKKVLDRHPMTI